jgi:two-component system, chemotaxis family, chemotaxis protein CheY
VRCLVVDESATTRRILRNVLRDLGADEVIEVGHGREALEHCDETLDLVITDRALPGLDGLDLVRRLREKPETAAIPVLMVAARGTRRDVLLAREAGVNGYVIKPFTPECLRPRLEALLRGEPPQAAPAETTEERAA